MRSLILTSLLLLACGPDVSAWKGTWTGALTFNFGRLPEAVSGSLVINDGAQFIATSVVRGTPATASVCTLNVNMADSTNLSFKAGDSCEVTADGCSHRATFQSLTASRLAETLTLRGNGTVRSTGCAGGAGSEQVDFSVSGDATRKP